MTSLLPLGDFPAAPGPATPRPAACLPPSCHGVLTLRLLSSAAVYGGSKAFVDAFSHSLDAEYAPLGVRVQNQSPMFVATKMSKIRCAAAAWWLGCCLVAAWLLPGPAACCSRGMLVGWDSHLATSTAAAVTSACSKLHSLMPLCIVPLAAGARGWMPPPPPPGRPRRSNRLGGRPASLPTGSTACRCACG